LLGVAAAVIGAWFSFLLLRDFFGRDIALATLLALLLNPVYLRAAIEAGTDMPTFALSVAATYLVASGSRMTALATAGFLAGYATITRYNAAFLVVAATVLLLRRPDRWRSSAWYGAGLAIPIVAWMAANLALTGSAFSNSNHLNFAFALYGHEMEWDRFWATSATRFHSFADVISYDPAAAARQIGANLATHWIRDARELMPLWIGAIAIPGMVLCVSRGLRRTAFVVHFALCYLTLATIFYAPRFFLYLLPFYLGAATVLVLRFRAPIPGGDAGSKWDARAGWLRWGVLGVLVVLSGARAVTDVRAMESNSPHEAREAGAFLRGRASGQASVMARKPHVAHFAGMQYVPLPNVATVAELIEAGRRGRVNFLYFSGLEENVRPQLVTLGVENADFPGLHQLEYRITPARRFFAIYQFVDEPFDSALMDRVQRRALERRVAMDPIDPAVRTLAAGVLMNQGAFRDALSHLEVAERIRPEDPEVAVLQAAAHQALGQYRLALSACDRASSIGVATAFQHGEIGVVYLRQRRFTQAIQHLAAAVRLEPTHALYLMSLGAARFEVGDYSPAAQDLERALALAPQASQIRLLAARAHWLAGRSRRALDLIESGRQAGASSPALEMLADSVAQGSR
jgi:tetratricopeptide (TPR) repeat protein